MIADEDLAEMQRRHHQEHLLFVAGFEPLLPDGRELWIRDDEPYLRSRALVSALEEQVLADEREAAR